MRSSLTPAHCLVAVSAHAQTFIGIVEGNHDGDTAYVRLQSGQEIIVRLANIDASELNQPFGRRAGPALRDLTYGKTVEIEYRSEYPYRERAWDRRRDSRRL
jgi:endonuclease YncB( thermonuclease family)